MFTRVQVLNREKYAYRNMVHNNSEKHAKRNAIILATQGNQQLINIWRSEILCMSTGLGERPYFGRDEAEGFRRR